MNPETNRFEQLRESTEEETAEINKRMVESLKNLAKVASGSFLLRPDGSPVPGHWPILSVGTKVEIEGYTFRVGYIGESVVLLEPIGIVEIGKGEEVTP